MTIASPIIWKNLVKDFCREAEAKCHKDKINKYEDDPRGYWREIEVVNPRQTAEKHSLIDKGNDESIAPDNTANFIYTYFATIGEN